MKRLILTVAFSLTLASPCVANAREWNDPLQPGRKVLVFVRFNNSEEAKESKEAIEATRFLSADYCRSIGLEPPSVEGIKVGYTPDCHVHIVDARRFPESAKKWGCMVFPTLIVTQDNRPIAATVRFPEIGHYRWSFEGYEDSDVYFSALSLPYFLKPNGYPKYSWQWSWPGR